MILGCFEITVVICALWFVSMPLWMPNAPMELPYEGAKEMLLVGALENRDFLKELLEAVYEGLPEPRKRK